MCSPPPFSHQPPFSPSHSDPLHTSETLPWPLIFEFCASSWDTLDCFSVISSLELLRVLCHTHTHADYSSVVDNARSNISTLSSINLHTHAGYSSVVDNAGSNISTLSRLFFCGR